MDFTRRKGKNQILLKMVPKSGFRLAGHPFFDAFMIFRIILCKSDLITFSGFFEGSSSDSVTNVS